MKTANSPSLKTVTEGLNFRTVDELKKMLQLLPIQAKPTRKAELVEAIANHLLGPGLTKLWQELDELQQAAVAEAIYLTGGRHQAEQFQAKYGALPQWHDHIYRYQQPAAKLDLFFYPASTYGNSNLLPEDLRLKLKAFVPEPRALTLPSAEQPPQTLRIEHRHFDYQRHRLVGTADDVPVVSCPTEQVAQQDLLTVLRLIHLGKVSVSNKTLMPTKATLTTIVPLLQGGDYYSEPDEPDNHDPISYDPIGAIKPFAWIMLVQGGGLASLDGKKLQLTKAGQKAMGATPATTLRSIWKKWLKTTFLDELRRVESIKGQTGKAKRSLTAVSGRRAQIAEVLGQCPVGEWVDYDDLKRYMIASDQTFEVSRNPENLQIREFGYGNLYEAEGSWSILHDAYMKCFLFEYAATLGLLDVAYITPYDAPPNNWNNFWDADDLSFLSRYDGLLAFRLTPLGAFCLGLSDTYTAAPITTENTLRVLPNLDVVMTGAPLNPAEQLMMETFTRQTSDAVWKLDRDVALKAAEAGHSLQEFYDFLTQASAEALPKTVEQFFADCRSRSQSLQDQGMARLIECADASLAAQIAHDSRTKKYCQMAGERHLVVLLDDETRFRNGLRKLGYSLPLSKGQ
ncbi:MAG: Helicase conserved C-terminal domain [Phormidium sp. OSCR]|nr:MAG: Helicase conserved C-terminal domain [Phormidium sp. OSCR]